MNVELLIRGLGAQKRSALIWAGSLFLLTLSVLALWPSMSQSGSLDSLLEGLPPEILSGLGMENYGSPIGFLNGNLYALFLPLLVTVLAILHMNSLTAGDEGSGRLELLMALPVSRVSIYFSRFIAVTITVVGIVLLVGVTVLIGGPAFDLDVDPTGIIAATLGVLLLALFYSSLTLALAGLGLRSSAVLGVSFGALALCYLIHALFPMIESLEQFAKASPWYWAMGKRPLENGFDGSGLALLIGSSSILIIIGLLTIRRRTIRTV